MSKFSGVEKLVNIFTSAAQGAPRGMAARKGREAVQKAGIPNIRGFNVANADIRMSRPGTEIQWSTTDNIDEALNSSFIGILNDSGNYDVIPSTVFGRDYEIQLHAVGGGKEVFKSDYEGGNVFSSLHNLVPAELSKEGNVLRQGSFSKGKGRNLFASEPPSPTSSKAPSQAEPASDRARYGTGNTAGKLEDFEPPYEPQKSSKPMSAEEMEQKGYVSESGMAQANKTAKETAKRRAYEEQKIQKEQEAWERKLERENLGDTEEADRTTRQLRSAGKSAEVTVDSGPVEEGNKFANRVSDEDWKKQQLASLKEDAGRGRKYRVGTTAEERADFYKNWQALDEAGNEEGINKLFGQLGDGKIGRDVASVDAHFKKQAFADPTFWDHVWGNKVPHAAVGVIGASSMLSIMNGKGQKTNAELYSNPF